MRYVVGAGLVLTALLVAAALSFPVLALLDGDGAGDAFLGLVSGGFLLVLTVPFVWLGVFVVYVLRMVARWFEADGG